MAAQLRADEVRTLADIYGVPPAFALAIWEQESGSGKNTKTSGKGARGGFQVIPSTFRQYNPEGNIDDPVDNATAALRYMRRLLDQYPPEEAAQAYYGGAPVRVRGHDYDSGPGTPTMSRYGQDVMQKMARYAPSQDDQLLPEIAYGMDMPDTSSMGSLTRPPASFQTPTLPQLADAGGIPDLTDIAASIPFGGGQPRENPLNALYAKMYGTVDTATGLPMDLALGLREARTPNAAEADLHQHITGLVDSTLNGMDFG